MLYSWVWYCLSAKGCASSESSWRRNPLSCSICMLYQATMSSKLYRKLTWLFVDCMLVSMTWKVCLSFRSVVLVSDFSRLGSDHYGSRLNLLGLVLDQYLMVRSSEKASHTWSGSLAKSCWCPEIWEYPVAWSIWNWQSGLLVLWLPPLILLQEQQFLLSGFKLLPPAAALLNEAAS